MEIEFRLENALEEYHHLVVNEIFTKEEVKELLKKQKEHEYALAKANPSKLEFLNYIAFLITIEKLKAVRIDLSPNKDLLDPLLLRKNLNRIRGVFKRLVTIYPKDLRLWNTYIKFLQDFRLKGYISGVFMSAINANPQDPDIWIRAANFEFFEMGKSEPARNIFQTAIDTIRGSGIGKDTDGSVSASLIRLYTEYLRFEILFILKIRKRKEILKSLTQDGVNISDVDLSDKDKDLEKVPIIVYKTGLKDIAAFGDKAVLRYQMSCISMLSEVLHRGGYIPGTENENFKFVLDLYREEILRTLNRNDPDSLHAYIERELLLYPEIGKASESIIKQTDDEYIETIVNGSLDVEARVRLSRHFLHFLITYNYYSSTSLDALGDFLLVPEQVDERTLLLFFLVRTKWGDGHLEILDRLAEKFKEFPSVMRFYNRRLVSTSESLNELEINRESIKELGDLVVARYGPAKLRSLASKWESEQADDRDPVPDIALLKTLLNTGVIKSREEYTKRLKEIVTKRKRRIPRETLIRIIEESIEHDDDERLVALLLKIGEELYGTTSAEVWTLGIEYYKKRGDFDESERRYWKAIKKLVPRLRHRLTRLE